MLLRYSILAIVILILDQVTKFWAYGRLRTGPDITVIDGLFKLSYTENPGIAFGMLSESESALKIWLLAAVSLAAVAVVIYFAIKAPPNNRLMMVALMCVLGGIIGNLIDRVRLGVVIDFILLYVGEYRWPTFNIADAAICIGAVLLSIDILRDGEPAAATAGSGDQPKEGASD